MTILMIVDAWFPHTGGGQVHVWELSKALADKGHKVVILTRNNGAWNEVYPGVTVKRLGKSSQFSNLKERLSFLASSFFVTLITDCDVIHLHAFSPGLLAPLLKFFKRKPVVFTVHGEGMKIAGLPLGEKFLEDLVFYKITYDGQISVAKQTLVKKGATKNVWVIPNGVRISDWTGAQRQRNKVKHLIFVGRFFYDKGVDLLIEAFKELKRKDLDLTIVGEGPELSKLKGLAKGQKIRFTGKLGGQKLVNEIRKADLYVMPSRVEGMPIRLLEAWAAKIPIVATKVGDNSQYIVNNKSGFLAEANVQSLANSIEKALKSNRLVNIAESGFNKVQDFTWNNIAEQTLARYKVVKKKDSSDKLVIIAFLFFIAYKFWLVSVAWSGRGLAPQPDDSYIYISLIDLFRNHGFLGKVGGIDNYSLMHVMYIAYTGPLSLFSKLTGISPENTFHLFFYIGEIILAVSLVYLLKNLTNNKKFIAYALIILALYNGNGNYHGFYWVVPSFLSVMLYLVLFGMLFNEKNHWYLKVSLLTLIFVLAHPISVFASLIFSNLVFNLQLNHWGY